MRTLIGSGRAKARPVVDPDELDAEPRYRPSRRLADFLLCRDLICRFPGCCHPAERCGTDHTIAWPAGAPTRRTRSGTPVTINDLSKNILFDGRSRLRPSRRPNET